MHFNPSYVLNQISLVPASLSSLNAKSLDSGQNPLQILSIPVSRFTVLETGPHGRFYSAMSRGQDSFLEDGSIISADRISQS